MLEYINLFLSFPLMLFRRQCAVFYKSCSMFVSSLAANDDRSGGALIGKEIYFAWMLCGGSFPQASCELARSKAFNLAHKRVVKITNLPNR